MTAGRPTSRSTRCASSPTARRAGKASRSPRPPPQPGARVTLVAGPVALADARRGRAHRCRDRRGDGRRGRWRPASRCRGLRRRRCRLAGSRPHEDQEGRRPAEADSPDPRHLASCPSPGGPACSIGFAAETDDVVANAIAKRAARAPTGSSPTTCRATSWAARRTAFTSSPRRVEDWPEAGQGRGRARSWPTASPRACMIEIKLIRLPHGDGLPLPEYATEDAAGLDVPGRGADARAGRAARRRDRVRDRDPARPRSPGPAALRPCAQARHHLLNTPGTIDSDYRGEVKAILVNLGAEPFAIARGERIAQLVPAPVLRAHSWKSTSLAETARGSGGFGSTGTMSPQRRRTRTLRPPHRPAADRRPRPAQVEGREHRRRRRRRRSAAP